MRFFFQYENFHNFFHLRVIHQLIDESKGDIVSFWDVVMISLGEHCIGRGLVGHEESGVQPPGFSEGKGEITKEGYKHTCKSICG